MSDKSLQNIKDTQKIKRNVLNKSLIENVFIKDYRKAFVYKKTEKLCKAVHLVLGQTHQRTEVVDRILSLSTGLIGEVLIVPSGAYQEMHQANKSILELMSLLEIAESSCLIGPRNTSLLLKEYGNLLATICEPVLGDQGVFVDVAIDEDSLRGVQKKTYRTSVSSKKTNKGQSKIKNNRKENVLNILKDKGSATLKDISMIISDCSTKTIQRLLTELIESGVVLKKGERRWSTYHIVE